MFLCKKIERKSVKNESRDPDVCIKGIKSEKKMEKKKVPKRLQGKVAIVTASTQGIGFGIVERLGLEGASVVVSSRKQVLLQFSVFSTYESSTASTFFSRI